jgi:hypothetical protein
MLFVLLSGCGASQAASAIKGDSAVRSNVQAVKYIQPAAVAPAAAKIIPVNGEDAAVSTPRVAQQGKQNSAAVVGPENFPEGYNPLTGLPVKDRSTLALAPALVSVTNFPVSARPQAGLSFSPFVFELYIGGDYPQKGADNGIALADDRIGPVRSGRLPYESLRQLYNGFLVMSSASSVVLPSLNGYTNVFGSDNDDINSAMIPATRLEEVASKNPKRLKEEALTGLKFDTAAPAEGKPARMVWIPFSFLNQVIWRYDAASGAYLRYQDKADGKTFVQATDRLNSQPLTYENVVVLFADHQAKRETLIDINLMYVNRKPALLFRDGKMYKIFWTTANGEYEKKTGLVRPIRFIDAQGNPFPLKPGQTWVEIVQDYTRYNETVDSEAYFELKNKVEPNSGNWAIHFFPTIPER